MTGVAALVPAGKALIIDPPALRLSEPELIMLPELEMLLKAFRFRLSSESVPFSKGINDRGIASEINPCGCTVMLLALRPIELSE
jgi:hypothetical protein